MVNAGREHSAQQCAKLDAASAVWTVKDVRNAAELLQKQIVLRGLQSLRQQHSLCAQEVMREQYRAGNLEDRSVVVDLPVRKGGQQHLDHSFQQVTRPMGLKASQWCQNTRIISQQARPWVGGAPCARV